MTMEGTGVMPVYDLNNRTAAADGAGFGGGWMWVVKGALVTALSAQTTQKTACTSAVRPRILTTQRRIPGIP